MIERYEVPEISTIWSEENKYPQVARCRAGDHRNLGRDGRGAEKQPEKHPAQRPVRLGPHPRDRKKGQARRHRVPDFGRRIDRRRFGLYPQGHHFLRRGRHGPVASDPGVAGRGSCEKLRFRPAAAGKRRSPTKTCWPSAAPTASTPSRSPSAASSSSGTRRCDATSSGCCGPKRRCRSARSPGRSGPISIFPPRARKRRCAGSG